MEYKGKEYDIELKYDVWATYDVGDYIEYEATRLDDDPQTAISRNPNLKSAETEAQDEEPAA